MIRKFQIKLRRIRIYFLVIPAIVCALLFLLYQNIVIERLEVKMKSNNPKVNLIRGTHEEEQRFYVKDSDGKFTCIRSMEEIDFTKINDNYCDCLDGSDEPGTNACTNSIFYCSSERKQIHSSKVNDGICDCCDGSDEWDGNSVNTLAREYQIKLRRYQTPCPNTCAA